MPGELTVGKLEPSRVQRVALVVLGIALGHFILYGPSLVGRRVLLPLDILADTGVYLPRSPEISQIDAENVSLADMICVYEPSRRFAISELRAGRLPMWTPYQYGGVPFTWPKFSPFLALEFCTESPVVLAWVQLLAALVAGIGIYVFLRKALALSFWPAAICAWCYPLTGYFIFWQGYPTSTPVCWLPWILLAVDRTVRATGCLAPIWLSVLTGLVLVSGQLDVGGQVLLGSGLYAVWCWIQIYAKELFRPKAFKPLMRLAAAWALGFLLAAPHVLPLVDYSRTGSRMERREGGGEERPPVGLAALPQVVLPDMYGAMNRPGLRFSEDHQAESSAAAYTGVLATLFVAPLAFCSRRHRAVNLFFVLLAVFGLSWCLNVPGVVGLLRLPGLNMMSHNRLVFLASFAILALAAVGLEALSTGLARWRPWMWAPTLVMAGFCLWSSYRTVRLPEPIATRIPKDVLQGKEVGWLHDSDGVLRMQARFVKTYAVAAFWCALGILGWLALRSRPGWAFGLLCGSGFMLLGELLWFAYGRNVQCDPALYYPSLPALRYLANAPPGRIIGYGCLPANLASMWGFQEVRGCDGVDPKRMVDLVSRTANPDSTNPDYAQTMILTPRAKIDSVGNVRLSPLLDMLGVRYVIFRMSPAPNARPIFQQADYWVLQNPAAMPRAYVPRRVELAADRADRLTKLSSPQFDPREVAYVESPVTLPASCKGAAEVLDEIPPRIRLSVQMETAGLVVLADSWNHGWHAYVGGKQIEVLRANHAVRGVVMPAGSAVLEFRYEPASFAWGLRLAGLGAVVLLTWAAAMARLRRLSPQAAQKGLPVASAAA